MNKQHVFYVMFLWGLSGMAMGGSKVHLKPGLWEIDIEMDNPGTPMVPMQSTMCMTQKKLHDMENGKLDLPAQLSDCKVTEYQHKGTHVEQKMVCPERGAGMSYEGEMMLDSPTSFHTKVHMLTTMMGHTFDNIQNTNAHWIGTCVK